jgi:hypothetical protein
MEPLLKFGKPTAWRKQRETVPDFANRDCAEKDSLQQVAS